MFVVWGLVVAWFWSRFWVAFSFLTLSSNLELDLEKTGLPWPLASTSWSKDSECLGGPPRESGSLRTQLHEQVSQGRGLGHFFGLLWARLRQRS